MSLTLSSSSVLALCFSFFLLLSTVTAFNITKILSDHPDFSNFNDMLTKTQLASTINSRQTITILAVDNGNISPLSGQPADMQKMVLSTHVILDYYDEAKLQKLPNKTELLTTLYQSSGQAKGQEGFLNATLLNGQVVLGSAIPGSAHNAKLVKTVVTQPYNVSVLQVSTVIMPSSGGSNSSSNSTSAPAPSSGASSSPASSPNNPPAPPKSSPPSAATPSGSEAPSPSTGKAPAAGPEAGDAPSADSPSPEADSPSGSPQASDAPAGSPEAPTPMSSPPAMGPVADGPLAGGPAADAPDAAGATTIAGTGTGLAMVVIVLYSALALAKMM